MGWGAVQRRRQRFEADFGANWVARCLGISPYHIFCDFRKVENNWSKWSISRNRFEIWEERELPNGSTQHEPASLQCHCQFSFKKGLPITLNWVHPFGPPWSPLQERNCTFWCLPDPQPTSSSFSEIHSRYKGNIPFLTRSSKNDRIFYKAIVVKTTQTVCKWRVHPPVCIPPFSMTSSQPLAKDYRIAATVKTCFNLWRVFSLLEIWTSNVHPIESHAQSFSPAVSNWVLCFEQSLWFYRKNSREYILLFLTYHKSNVPAVQSILERWLHDYSLQPSPLYTKDFINCSSFIHQLKRCHISLTKTSRKILAFLNCCIICFLRPMPRSSSRLITKTCSKGSLKTVAVGGSQLDIRIGATGDFDQSWRDQKI